MSLAETSTLQLGMDFASFRICWTNCSSEREASSFSVTLMEPALPIIPPMPPPLPTLIE